jgi:hypothetical protein
MLNVAAPPVGDRRRHRDLALLDHRHKLWRSPVDDGACALDGRPPYVQHRRRAVLI